MTDEEWQELRNDPAYQKNPNMDFYRQYGDEEGVDTFKKQILRALQNRNNLGSAYPLWKQHVLRGVPFFMITARSHFPASMRMGMEAFIRADFSEQELKTMRTNFVQSGTVYDLRADMGWWGEAYRDPNVVFQNYLHGCEFYPVSSPYWAFRHSCGSVAECKAFVVSELVPYALAFERDAQQRGEEQTTVMSFYDDDSSNVKAVMARMVQLAAEHPEICFRVYDTSNPKQAVQHDINRACDGLNPGADWQSAAFLRAVNAAHRLAHHL